MLEFNPSFTQVVEKEGDYDEWAAEFQCCTVSAQVTLGWPTWVQQFSIFPVSKSWEEKASQKLWSIRETLLPMKCLNENISS